LAHKPFLFLDVAGTLLGKPSVVEIIYNLLAVNKIAITKTFLADRHRLLSEVIRFPDRTSRDFYLDFNFELLMFLGLTPSKELAEEMYLACRYMPWEPFADVEALQQCPLPMGIISNWDTTLPEKLAESLPKLKFEHILSSEALGVRKPDPAIFALALQKAGLDAKECIFVGDSIRLDVAPASAAGIETYLIDRQNLFGFFNGKRISSFHQLING
jgi:HAD superfamily hydrolase (TIGR01509 family)